MDFGAVLFGGLSLLAFLRKKSSEKSNVDDDVKSNTNLDSNITFLTDTEYQNYLDKIEQDKYNDYLTKKAEEEAKKAEEEAKKAEEEAKKKLLEKYYVNYDLNNSENIGYDDITFYNYGFYNLYYMRSPENINNEIYKFTSDADLLRLGINLSTGEQGMFGQTGLYYSRVMPYPFLVDNVLDLKYTEVYAKPIENKDGVTIYKTSKMYLYSFTIYMEIINPIDRTIYIDINNFKINYVSVCGNKLYPYAPDDKNYPYDLIKRIALSDIDPSRFQSIISNVNPFIYLGPKYYGFEAIDFDIRYDDLDRIGIPAKGNRFFQFTVSNLASFDKLNISDENSFLKLGIVLYSKDLGVGKFQQPFELSLIRGEEPSIIDMSNGSRPYYNKNLNMKR